MPKHPPSIDTVPTGWQTVILVCRKCSKKLDGGFGPDRDRSITTELKQALRTSGRRSTTRLIETKCLGVCPKGAVTVLPATTPGSMLTIPAGTPAETILFRLLPPP